MSAEAIRVVTVGATDAARALRREAGVEVVRTDDPLDAVAELAMPHEGAPVKTAAIVDVSRLPVDEVNAFLAAARTAAPGVVVLSSGSEATAGFDGEWTEAEPAREVLAGVSHAEVSDREAGVVEGHALTDDAELAHLDRFIRGQTSREALLGMVSKRLGVAVAVREREPGGGESSALIERRGRRYGWLVAGGVDSAALRAEAAYLAGWMALEEQVEQLRSAAFLDDLTGAWNRGYFRRRLPRAIEAAKASRRDLTLMIYDIDNFKHYNDTYGHGAGDEILTETVKLLQSVIRPTDRVCRIGGDEFAVIFDDSKGARESGGRHPRSIGDLARRFQQQICSHRFPALGDHARTTLTISGGMATYPWDAGDAAGLIGCADRLLLESKRRGKNVITLGPGADAVCRVEFPEE